MYRFAHWGMVKTSNADGKRCMNSVSVSVLTKGQGGAILLMDCTKLQGLKNVGNVSNRVCILWYSEKGRELKGQIAKRLRNHVSHCHVLSKSYSQSQAQWSRTGKKRLGSSNGSRMRRYEPCFLRGFKGNVCTVASKNS